MCSTTLPGGSVVTFAYDAASGIDRRGEFLLSLGDRGVPVAVPKPRSPRKGALNRRPDRLSYTETTAFRLEDRIALGLRFQFGVSAKDARVAARSLLWQMVRAHPGLVSFSTEISRWDADVPGA